MCKYQVHIGMYNRTWERWETLKLISESKVDDSILPENKLFKNLEL